MEAREHGALIEPAAIYSVAVNSSIATRGDDFTVLLGGIDQLGGPIDLDALIDYRQDQHQPVAIPPLGRTARVN